MKKRKKPVLANRFLVRAGVNLYGRRFFKKQVTLTCNADLSKITPPYVVVANHSNFVDVGGLIMLMSPTCANFVISETQIVNWPKLINYLGILSKRQFTVDTTLIRDIKYVLSKNRPVAIYPEAKLSVDGTLNIIKPSIAKLIKMLKVPLVTVRFDGAYLHKPRWAKSRRFVPVRAEVKIAVRKEEIDGITAEEIHNRILENLNYDDYAYQLERNIEIDVPDLAEGLENILYKCSECGEEFAMTARGNKLTCLKCGKQIEQDKLGRLVGGKFGKVTDWYEWQRVCVKEELEKGVYGFKGYFRVEKLINKDYADLGEAELTHNADGITVSWDTESLFYKAGAFYTLSFNNDYIFLPTAEAVYRFKRQNEVGCTAKLNLAVEEQTKLLEKDR